MSASELKDEGNAKFKAGEFSAAVEAYTRSLDLEPDQHLCFSNRSAAYLKLGNSAEEALKDANRCVELVPGFAKGYSRQAAALQELKRWDEALAVCERGFAETSDSMLQVALTEVRSRSFVDKLLGVWHGRVTEALGGYEQEMEFLDDASVRVEVLGRSIVGRYWVDGGGDPKHLNIQVPMQDIPPGMPPPPPVPYIAKIDDNGLHVCCPYMKMERPTAFEGPGYCLMAKGSVQKAAGSDISHLSRDEKLRECAKDLIDALPNRKLEEVQQSDSEEDTRDKLMAQVKFESSMFAVQQKFGEDIMKDVLNATKASPDSAGVAVPEALANSSELNDLIAKLRVCGILDEPTAAKAMASQPVPSPSSAPSRAPKEPASEATSSAPRPPPKSPEDDKQSQAGSSGISAATAGVIALSLTAAAAVALLLFRRQRR
ncbi:unnamed protein product [Polarella glacialis]|uniref:Uncharacterized protein n=1 Tax=Polarella glacialis TaxID=89957 RepID=A0A813KWW5_POLGL|nr:unnamed protein product [Polarella glacialis]CAE8711299.1 unnamed protein product [Polarella glacialis]